MGTTSYVYTTHVILMSAHNLINMKKTLAKVDYLSDRYIHFLTFSLRGKCCLSHNVLNRSLVDHRDRQPHTTLAHTAHSPHLYQLLKTEEKVLFDDITCVFINSTIFSFWSSKSHLLWLYVPPVGPPPEFKNH